MQIFHQVETLRLCCLFPPITKVLAVRRGSEPDCFEIHRVASSVDAEVVAKLLRRLAFAPVKLVFSVSARDQSEMTDKVIC